MTYVPIVSLMFSW